VALKYSLCPQLIVSFRSLQPGGHLILSTISRTPLARLVAITLAESPLIRLAPAGSHTYEKFIRPDEIINFFTEELKWPGPSPSTLNRPSGLSGHQEEDNHLSPEHKSLRYDMEVRGTTYFPWKGEWLLFNADDGKGVMQNLAKSCNYFFGARKPLA
jgi:polyprenyldihydroxybenzoate methyltransferase/3-demethylubiquinol 3-O-methyltransferase